MSIEGLPPELHLRGQGETRIDGLPRPLFSFLLYSEGKGQMTICFVSQRDPFRGKNVSLHTSMELWAFEEKAIYTAAFGTIDLVKIPGVGLCQRGLRSGLNCWFGPLRPVDVSMRIPEEGVIQSWPVSSQISGSIQQQDEVVWGFIPIEKLQGYLPESVSEVPFTKLIPVEHFRTTFSSEGFPLSEYGIHKALTAPLE